MSEPIQIRNNVKKGRCWRLYLLYFESFIMLSVKDELLCTVLDLY